MKRGVTDPVPNTESCDSGVLVKPDCSASAIANGAPHLYDAFGHVTSPGAFIPNPLLQRMLKHEPDPSEVLSLLSKLDVRFVDSFRKVPNGSESKVVDLNLQRLLSAMADLSHGKLICKKDNATTVMYLAKSGNAEHSLYPRTATYSSIALFGAEAKGIEASLRACYPQFIASCGSSCIELHRRGLALEECALVGVVMAGASCQFCGVYLIEGNFPVMVALSPALHIMGTPTDHREIARWAMRSLWHTMDRLDALQAMQHKGFGMRLPSAAEVQCTLSLRGHFTKPIRDDPKMLQNNAVGDEGWVSALALRLNCMMEVYRLLHEADPGSSDVILFPTGVVTVPGPDSLGSASLRSALTATCRRYLFSMELSYRPVVLFPLLGDWRTDKPPAELRQSYLAQVALANNIMNQAGVAHMDERPENVMWRARTELDGVELQVIDLEDAVLFGFPVSSDYVTHIINQRDRRYPFLPGDEESTQIAGTVHNEFYLEALTRWVESDVDCFRTFMAEVGADILTELRAHH